MVAEVLQGVHMTSHFVWFGVGLKMKPSVGSFSTPQHQQKPGNRFGVEEMGFATVPRGGGGGGGLGA